MQAVRQRRDWTFFGCVANAMSTSQEDYCRRRLFWRISTTALGLSFAPIGAVVSVEDFSRKAAVLHIDGSHNAPYVGEMIGPKKAVHIRNNDS